MLCRIPTSPRVTMARYHLWLLYVTAFGIASVSCQTPDNLKADDSPLSKLAREEEDNSRYKTLEANATVLELLVDNKDGVSRTEVFDMLHSKDDNEEHMDFPTFPEDAEDSKADVPALPDSQAEFLQAAESTVTKDSQRVRYTASARGAAPAGEAAGIMIVVTCSVVCIAYTALIVWRRIYLKRNGLKHELLRNEEVIAETRIEL